MANQNKWFEKTRGKKFNKMVLQEDFILEITEEICGFMSDNRITVQQLSKKVGIRPQEANTYSRWQ